MHLTRSALALAGTLVHQSATHSFLARSKHEMFIAQKLAFGFSMLAVAPFYLAFKGAPNTTACLLFGLGLVPLGAATLVSRTGRIVLGHAIAFCGLVGICLTLFLGAEAGAACALAWLLAAQLELTLSLDGRLNRIGSLVSGALLGCIVLTTVLTDAPAAAAINAPVAGLALVYGWVGARILATLSVSVARREKEQGARLMAVAETIGDLVVSFASNGAVDSVSATCETMLGVTSDDLLGRGLFDRVHVADRPAFLNLIANAAQCGKTLCDVVRVRTGRSDINSAGYVEPQHIWVEARVRKLARPTRCDAQETDVVAILRDVTATRQHDLAMEAAHLATERAIRSKDHFLANMSHELRTPLNAIIGFSEMLGSRTMRPADQDKQREYAGIIHQSGQHLLAAVNAVLDMSKIQSGTFDIAPEPFDLVSLIDQCCETAKPEARQGRIALVREIPPGIEEIVADRRACKQVLVNLLSNAIKFTPEDGRVTVRLRPEGAALVITVRDTGIGIHPEDMTRLGEPFFQARSSHSRPYGGTGLGLSVVRGLVGLHGGTVAIESEMRCGTSVTVRLPLDCRVALKACDSATITTLPGRPPIEPDPRTRDMRMKTSA